MNTRSKSESSTVTECVPQSSSTESSCRLLEVAAADDDVARVFREVHAVAVVLEAEILDHGRRPEWIWMPAVVW